MKNRNLLYLFVLIFIIACSKDDDHFSGSLGNLEIAQYDFIAGTSHRLPVYLKTTPEVMLDDQSVEVFLENAVGNEIDRIGSLYDNGDVTYYNDDIAGDLVFSGFITLNVAEEGAYSIVAKAQTTSGQRIESSPVEIHVYQKAGFEGREMVEDVFEASEDILQSYISSGRSMEASIQLTIDDLKMNENISEVTRIPNSNYLEVLMANNRKSVIAIYDADNPIKGGKSSDRGTPKRRLGKVEEANVNILRDINPFAPGNRNVLIYSPHESFFQDGAAVKNVFEEADCGEFKIDYVTGTNAGIDILNNLSDYGTIYISAHGVGGAILSTGEQIQSTHWGDNKFQALWGAEKVVPSNELTVDGQEVVSGDHVWLITYKWFDQNLSNLPNSMVFLNACQSTMTSRLSDAFLSAGAS
ncbi:MAG: hypothetical protein R3275_04010, partial [Saprospiraceae bacterium]|nr:hypothetical protein [Saprospiraceae bacterium]